MVLRRVLLLLAKNMRKKKLIVEKRGKGSQEERAEAKEVSEEDVRCSVSVRSNNWAN